MMKFETYQNLKLILIIAVIFAASIPFYYCFLFFVPQLFGCQPKVIYVAIVYALADVAYIPLIIYLSRKKEIQISRKVNLPGIQLVMLLVLLAISGLIILLPFYNPVDYFTHLVDRRLKVAVFDISQLQLRWGISFFGFALISPVIEEILWRKQIQGLLMRNLSPFWSIVLTSVLFACWHLRISNIIALFAWSLLFGVVYYKTKSMVASMILHSFNNILILMFKHTYVYGTPLYLVEYVTVIAVSVLVIYLIIKNIERYTVVKTQISDENASLPLDNGA